MPGSTDRPEVRGPAAAPPPRPEGPGTARPSPFRLAVFYNRPVEDPFHGGATHAREFIAGLSRLADVTTVAPRPRGRADLWDRPASVARTASDFLRLLGLQARFFLAETSKGRPERVRAMVVVDAYSGVLPLLWARIARVGLAYYAWDASGRVSNDVERIGLKGGAKLRVLRAPLEQRLVRASDAVAVVTDVLRHDFLERGVAAEKLVVCEMPRRRVAPDPPRVADWRRRLAPGGEVVIVFVGTLGYRPNQRAADFIVARLVPALDGARRRWRLVLVGAGSDRLRPPDDRVVGLGPVEDLDNLLYASEIGIAPIEVEGGISGKVVDYLTHGLVAVVTPQAASGVAASESMVVAAIASFPATVRDLVDREPRLTVAQDRPLEESIARHYFANPGMGELVRKLAAARDRAGSYDPPG